MIHHSHAAQRLYSALQITQAAEVFDFSLPYHVSRRSLSRCLWSLPQPSPVPHNVHLSIEIKVCDQEPETDLDAYVAEQKKKRPEPKLGAPLGASGVVT